MHRLALVFALFGCAAATPRPSPAVTGVDPSGAWSFAILGDSRDDVDSAFPAIAAQIHNDPGLAFTVHLGDMVPRGGESQLKDFLQVATPLRDCLFPVIGNHEVVRDPDRSAFKAAFGLKGTSYSFNYGNAHFAIIDNASQEFSPGVLQWLRADLETNKKGTAGVERVFVAMHIPPAIPGLKVHVEGRKLEKFQAGSTELLALMREYAVDVVFAGHLHQARTIEIEGGPRLVISGAAGAPQGWLKNKLYGYHRVVVSRDAVRTEFVGVEPGISNPAAGSSKRAVCPRIANVGG